MALSICSWIFVDGATRQPGLNAKTVRGFRLQACGWSYVFIQGGAKVSDKLLIIQVYKFDQRGTFIKRKMYILIPSRFFSTLKYVYNIKSVTYKIKFSDLKN